MLCQGKVAEDCCSAAFGEGGKNRSRLRDGARCTAPARAQAFQLVLPPERRRQLAHPRIINHSLPGRAHRWSETASRG
eukprot:scaffold127477_cov56-Phaeocystis_antarctica.AAC.1